MGKTALLVLLYAAISVAAQTGGSTPTNPSQIGPSLYQAPTPGHALNPADVQILTGNARPAEQRYAPHAYYGTTGIYYGPNLGYNSALPLLGGGGALGSSGTLNSWTPHFSGLGGQALLFGRGTPILPFVLGFTNGFVKPFTFVPPGTHVNNPLLPFGFGLSPRITAKPIRRF